MQDAAAKKRTKLAEKRLRKQFKANGWPLDLVSEFEPLKWSANALGNSPYELIYPGFIDPNAPDDRDVLEICGENFLPFGACSNGDFVVVVVVEADAFKLGQVCLLSLSLSGQGRELSYYVRFVCENLGLFFRHISDDIFPSDCHDASEVSPPLMAKFRKKKKKRGS